MNNLPARRAQCATCLRPASACICRWITPLSSATSLLILQHPMEVANAKGSARLLQLSVAGSVMVSGESFDAAALSALLYADGRAPLLLYPDSPGMATPPALDAAVLATPSALRLVVLDGTWRKSRKMLYLNPLLQSLPRLPLSQMPPSQYRIRKAHAPDQLSTLEAACYALAQLGSAPEACRPLLDAFDGFVGQYAATLDAKRA